MKKIIDTPGCKRKIIVYNLQSQNIQDLPNIIYLRSELICSATSPDLDSVIHTSSDHDFLLHVNAVNEMGVGISNFTVLPTIC